MKHLCSCVKPFWLQLSFFDLILASMGDAEEEYSRNKADPSISVDDLEQCLERYFKKVEFRNLQEALDLVKEANTSWKSAAKAILCKARLIGFDLIVGVFSLLCIIYIVYYIYNILYYIAYVSTPDIYCILYYIYNI